MQDINCASGTTHKRDTKPQHPPGGKMKETTTISRERSGVLDNVSIEVGKVGIGFIVIASTLIGLWALACLISGMASSGGPAGLVSSFFSAITG
jgi:hypothetical protein